MFVGLVEQGDQTLHVGNVAGNLLLLTFGKAGDLAPGIICVDPSAPAAPALDSPVAPAGARGGEAERDQGSVALSF